MFHRFMEIEFVEADDDCDPEHLLAVLGFGEQDGKADVEVVVCVRCLLQICAAAMYDKYQRDIDEWAKNN